MVLRGALCWATVGLLWGVWGVKAGPLATDPLDLLQQFSRGIWEEPATPSNGSLDDGQGRPLSGDGLDDSLADLDSMLVLLNSKALNRRQAPSECPYCMRGYPCPTGCPTVPEDTSCTLPETQCPPGPPGLRGLPGPQGPAGWPIYIQPDTNDPGRPGLPGFPGNCLMGPRGEEGLPGLAGTCETTDEETIVISKENVEAALRRMPCAGPSGCQHSIPRLLDRLRQLELKLNRANSFERKLGEYRMQYSSIKNNVRGTPGPPGAPGASGYRGHKGVPGAEGVHGSCIMGVQPLRALKAGAPGVEGPKGDPGPRGNKNCACPGNAGPKGHDGIGGHGSRGPRGKKGLKGVAARTPDPDVNRFG